MTVYTGVVDGTWRSVYVADGRMKPLPHIVRHSPDGFSWGFGGSGPAELAHSLLVYHTGGEVEPAVYQRFKEDVIAALPMDRGFVLDGTTVDAWLKERGSA